MDLKYKLLIVLALCGFSYGLGRYLTPDKIITKEVTIEKEVIKEVVKENTNIKKNTQTKIVETTFPDGKYVKETYILDQDTVVIEKDKVVSVDKEVTKQVEKIIENSKPQYGVAAGAGYNLDQLKVVYNVQVERRILGPLFLGAYGTTNREVGALLKMEF